MAVITPEAPAAGGPDMIYMSVPIEKSEDTADINPVDGTPDLTIWGKVTDGTLDSDLQIVDPEASLRWIQTWHATKSNVRMGHDPRQPVGRGIEIQGHYVKSLICDPRAKHLIRNKVLNDYSIGIMHPDVRKGDPRFRHLDPQGKAVNGVITDRADGITGLGEISVVDRGANFGSAFQLVKAAADGSPEWTGMWTGDAPHMELPEPRTLGLVSVDLPSDMKLKVTPDILAKMATLKRDLVLREAAAKAAGEQFIAKAAGAAEAPELAAIKSAEGGVYKRDVSTAERRELHGQGRALDNLSYPVKTHEDADNAVTLILSGHGNVKAARRMVSRIARQEGWTDILDRLKSSKKLAAPGIVKDDDDKLGQCPSCKGRGFVKKPANMKCEACGGSGRAASKAAAADVTKCMKCDGSGMFEEKPCPDCKDGDKAATPGAEKKKGKMRALCPNCGAKQNPEHKHCPECGKPLPASAVQVAKNHNFVCLGCGHELDKGEPHCPECGKSNPGYLPEADRKIPANEDADKSAGKDRVAKGKKSGKKGKMPFGGNQAKPFGSDDKDESPDKATAEKRRKGKGKGRNPGAGVKGHEDNMGLPPHREPDGAPVEQFENDSRLEDGDQQMKAALRHKSFSALLTPDEACLHDLTCPAFSPKSVEACLPHASLAAIDTAYWAQKTLDAATHGDPNPAAAVARYNQAQALSQAAVTLKMADPQVMHQLRVAGHQAFLQANKDVIKTFTDATPGPGSAPTPAGYVMPGSFRRPYISAGHAAASPQYEPARSFPVITDHPQAQEFHRGYLSVGHASESPDNNGRPEPMPEGNAGAPESRAQGAAQMQARDYESAVSTMHDHLSRIAPGICPMSPEMGRTQKPAPQVPAAVGAPEPHGAKASKAERAARKAKAAAKAARVAKAKAAAQKRRVQDQLLKGKITVEEAQAKLGMTVKSAAPPENPLAAAVAPVVDVAAADPAALAAAVKAAVTPLVKRQRATDKALRKANKMLGAIADQPDTSGAPYRGAGMAAPAYKTSAMPAAPQTAAEASAMAQTGLIQRLNHEWRNSPDPQVREAAYLEMTAQLGLNPMTQNPTQAPPFTR